MNWNMVHWKQHVTDCDTGGMHKRARNTAYICGGLSVLMAYESAHKNNLSTIFQCGKNPPIVLQS